MTEINYMCLAQLKLLLLIFLFCNLNRALFQSGLFLPSIKYKNYKSQTKLEIETVNKP